FDNSIYLIFSSLFTSLLFYSYFLYSNLISFSFFFFNDTATTEIYTLSLHDALPIFPHTACRAKVHAIARCATIRFCVQARPQRRSEEHTSELQSRGHLVCRLLLEKKNEKKMILLLSANTLYSLS